MLRQQIRKLCTYEKYSFPGNKEGFKRKSFIKGEKKSQLKLMKMAS